MRKLETKSFGDREVTVYLTESQWRGLLRRFNEEEIHEDSGLFRIAVPCALCVEFAPKRGAAMCTGCPLSDAGCLGLLESHGSEALSAFTGNSKIEWLKDADKEVRMGIRKIRSTLLGMPRTRRV